MLLMMPILLSAALVPIILLGFFIYSKDTNKEPKGLLILIFFMGFLATLPILIGELLFELFFPIQKMASYGMISIFFSMFFGVALFEEGFKWLVTYCFGYRNKEYDEVFDIIVYSVFASLGFACIENIVYVFESGLYTAFLRAVLSIPGHTCFAIAMGYFFSKAKMGQINGNKTIYGHNMMMSILVPMLLHAAYDGLLYYVPLTGSNLLSIIPFLIFFIIMVISCFIQVDKTAKVQQTLSVNISNGSIMRDQQGLIYYNYQNTLSGVNDNMNSSSSTINTEIKINFCPACGSNYDGGNFCRHCGFRLK